MKNKLVLSVALVALAVMFSSAPVTAHHGAAAYDMSKAITTKATVTSLVWANPHCELRFDTKNEKGDVIHWSTEIYNPIYMTRAGWTKDTLKAGDEITVTFNPAKNGTPNGIIREGVSKIVFNGQELGLSQR